MFKKLALLAAALTLPGLASAATIVTYDFNWAGSDGYSMSGYFTYDQEDAADRRIRDGEVMSIVFEGFIDGVSFGVVDDANTVDGFNFNFNTRNGRFLTNGSAVGNRGQAWNIGGFGFAYLNDFTGSALFVDGDIVGVAGRNRLRASFRSIQEVPAPATLALLGMGLFGLGLARRNKKA
ncbi:MAG: PEP-CTERM sorting domain-containing protein [Woeseiaceae bacterium]